MLQIIKHDQGFDLRLNNYEIDNDYNITSHNASWFLLRKEYMDDKMNEYNLKEGDILKIGRITIRIKTIKFAKNNNNNNNIDNKSVNTNFSQNLKEVQLNLNKTKKTRDSKDATVNKLCRICYGEEESGDNPLVQPCTCSGSMKYIHLNCLKTWINTSVIIKLESTEYCNVYTYKPAECELCKTTLPDFIRHKGKLYEILDYYNNFSSFLIFECLIIDRPLPKYIYVVNLDIPNNKINIGRGHNSNILLNDISVSRVHCFLNINKSSKKIFISDNNSKFGTLILVQTQIISLTLDLILHIQIGRSYLQICSKRPISLFGCCGVYEKKNSDFYYLQNNNKDKFTNKLTVKTENDTMDGFEEKDKIIDVKEETKDIDFLKTKVNLMDDNDLEGLLITKPFETNNNNEINENNEKELINGEDKNEIEDSIVIKDDDNDKSENNIKNPLLNDDNNNQNEIIYDKKDNNEE